MNAKFSNLITFFVLLIVSFSCQKEVKNTDEKDPKTKSTSYFFNLQDAEKTNIKFINTVLENDTINYLTFESIYNGGGVAVGDINNDGLADIYFGGNSSDDQLFLNKGNFEFEDITTSSGVINDVAGWSTGINMIDINADGYLDIYVCRSGPYKQPQQRENKLFINNKDNTFTESGQEYGLNHVDYSRQTAFFDYDLDGDLDMYLMNQPAPGFTAGALSDYIKKIKNNELQTDYFLENINGKFVDKTKEANLINFGYGHSIAVSDINDDGYPDFHVTHDYDDPDYLYYNTGNKSFENKINDYFSHISLSSMGNDFSDINNDGLVDLFTLEMAPDDHVRSKLNMKAMDPIKFNALVDNDLHHQYMFNTLQLNHGNNAFSDIAQMAGIAKTDWSWSCLFFDIDNDGNKDLFISNGIKRNFLYRDLQMKLDMLKEEKGRNPKLSELLDIVPSQKTDNVIYKNDGDNSFIKNTKNWIDDYSANTNGVAYADLDNDGDLDLVTNNMESMAGIFENKAANGMGGNFIRFLLKGSEKNPFAIGTKIQFEKDGKIYMQELYNARGYLSSMNYEMVFGIGTIERVENVKVIWPDRTQTILPQLGVNKTHMINYADVDKTPYAKANPIQRHLKKVDAKSLGISFKHQENKHDDYKNQVLLPYSQSKHGPFIDKADVNGDGLEDFYVGGALGQSGEMYIQNVNGSFKKQLSAAWENDKHHEDLGVLFFDADNDQDQDLYVVSGGTEYQENHVNYQDRLYLNDGKGNFSRSLGSLPRFNTSGQVVTAADIDGDGDSDLFVGGRIIPEKYPYPPQSHILINTNGKFTDQTQTIAPYLTDHSMITGASFSDYDKDGDMDLITVGEWSTIAIHENENGQFTLKEVDGLEKTRGLWFGLDAADIDGDGDMDFIAGNIGLNTKFKADKKKEFHVFCDDFDNSGTYDIVLSNTYNGNLVPVRGRECSSQQMPFIKEQFGSFQSFAEADLNTIIGVENLENALHYQIDILYSVYVENLGDGQFEVHQLPNAAQLSPIMKTQFIDIDNDGNNEILTMGNLFNVEVETVRFDASVGAVLKGDGSFSNLAPQATGFYANKDAKSSVIVGKYLIVTNNNDVPDIFEIN